MSFLRRRLPLVVVVILGCRMDNPAFGDDEFADEIGTGQGSGESSANDEMVDGSGSSEGVDTLTSTSSNDGATSTSTSTSTSDDVDTTSTSDDMSTSSSSSEGSDMSTSTSEGSTSTDTSTESGMLTDDGMLDGPNLNCPQVEPAENCFQCMQNNCCMDADLQCFNQADPKCTCILMCMAEGGDTCVSNCQAENLPVPTAHAEMIYECGVAICPLYCNL